MTRKKLIEQYKSKITDCDKLINDATEKIKGLRKDPDSYFLSIDELSQSRFVQDSKRQCYIQFIHDLKDELDETECLLYVDPEKSCQALKDRKKELNLSMNCEREDWLHPEELDDVDLLTD